MKIFSKTVFAALLASALSLPNIYGADGDNIDGVTPPVTTCKCPPCKSSDPAANASPQASMPAGSMGAASSGGGGGGGRSRSGTGVGMQNCGPESIPWKGGSSYTGGNGNYDATVGGSGGGVKTPGGGGFLSGNGNYNTTMPVPGLSGGRSTGHASSSISYGSVTYGPESLAKLSGTLPGLSSGAGKSTTPTPQLAVNIKSPSPTAFTPSTEQVQIGRGTGWNVPGKVQMAFDSSNNFTANIPNNAGSFGIKGGSEKTPSGANYALQGGFENASGMKLTAEQVGGLRGGSAAEGSASAGAGNYFVLNRNDGTKARYDAVSGKLADFTTAQGKRVSMGTGKGEIIESAGELRQIKSAEGLMNIRMLPGKDQGYVAEYYDASQITGKSATGEYAFSGAPKRGMTVENPNWESGGTGSVKITGSEGGRTVTNTYTYGESNKEWTNLRGDGSRVVERESEQSVQPVNIGVRFDVENGKLAAPAGAPAGSAKITEKTSELFDASNNLVSRTKTIYWIPNDNSEQKLAEIKDEGGLNETTRWTYYTDTADTARYARIKSELHPDGSWETYAYDDAGRVVTETRPWQDTPYSENPGTAGTRQTRYDYAPVIPGDILQENDGRPRTKTEYINGIEVGRTYYGYPKNAADEVQEIVERAATQGAGYGAAGNLRTTTTYYAEGADEASAGEVRSIETSDGLLTSFTYTLDENATGDLDAYLTTTKTEGTVASPAGVSGKTLRRVTKKNKAGQAFSEETQVYAGGTYTRLNLFESRYNVSGKLIQSLKDGRVTYDAVWQDDLLVSETDEAGITTEYTYDALKELNTATKKGIGGQPDIVTSYNRTAGGLDCGCNGNVETVATAGGLSQRAMTKKDKIGRLIEETTTTGLTTTYAYTDGGRTVTALLSNTATKIAHTALDGTSKSLTGTGAVAEYYTAGINTDGTRWQKTTLVSPDGPRWTKTTKDFLGRVLRTETPGFAGAILATDYTYNNAGLIAVSKQTVTGGSAPTSTGSAELNTTSYSYDEIGGIIKMEVTRGNITNITETDTTYIIASGSVWRESFQKQDGIVTLRSRVRLIAAGNIVEENWLAEAPSSNAPGFDWGTAINVVHSTWNLDRTSATQVVTTKYADSEQPRVETQVGGLLTSLTSQTNGGTITYKYDELCRLTESKQPRNSAPSKIEYNGFGQVSAAIDAAGNRTEYTYFDNGTRGAGQLRQQTDALGNTAFFQYNDLRQQIYTWGNKTYPIAQGYDFYGQSILLRTFRKAPGGATFPDNTQSDDTTWTYDEATGILLQRRDAAGKGAGYDYYADGNVRTRTWARKDASGNPIVSSYTYNAQSYLEKVDYSDATPDVTYAYNNLGQPVTVTDGAGTRNYTYDPVTRAATKEKFAGLINGTLNRPYDALNRSTGYAFVDADATKPTASSTYGYDVNGRFNQLAGNTVPSELTPAVKQPAEPDVYNYSRLANSDLVGTVAGAIVLENVYEENRTNLTMRKHTNQSAQEISAYEYGYDEIGRRMTQKQSGSAFTQTSTDTFSYNTRSEVTGSTNDKDVTGNRGYAYDSAGNRTSATDSTGTKTYLTDALNQYISISGDTTATPTYDDDGNMTGDGEGSFFEWDAENRLIAVRKGESRTSYVYDSASRRVEKRAVTGGKTEITRYAYHQRLLIREETQTPEGVVVETNTYTWGLDLSNTIQGAGGIGGLLSRDTYKDGVHTHYRMLSDGRGNITGIVDATGKITTQTYDVFGNITKTGDIGNFGFSTKYSDKETGLIYYGYRYYNPKTGKWLSRDPIGTNGGVNLTAFAYNEPLRFIDAHGLDCGDNNATDDEHQDPEGPSSPSTDEKKANPDGTGKVSITEKIDDVTLQGGIAVDKKGDVALDGSIDYNGGGNNIKVSEKLTITDDGVGSQTTIKLSNAAGNSVELQVNVDQKRDVSGSLNLSNKTKIGDDSTLTYGPTFKADKNGVNSSLQLGITTPAPVIGGNITVKIEGGFTSGRDPYGKASIDWGKKF